MPVEFDIWRIDDGQVTRVAPARLDVEARLDAILAQDTGVLGLDLLVIGCQVITAFGKRIDVLGVNAQGHVCVIENKRDRTPREVVAQILDYASWVTTLTYDDLTHIYSEYQPAQPFDQAFADRFGAQLPDTVNEQHHLYIVASELDASTERIVTYLSTQYGVPINAIFFRYYSDPPHEYLARTWLIEQTESEELARTALVARRSKDTWNGHDFYVSLGEGVHRAWQDCRMYGFISGGQGRWYSHTLDSLFVDARVFVCIPRKGYMGVGIVKQTARPVRDVMVEHNGVSVPLLDAPLQAPSMDENADDPELSEYVVCVEWLKTLAIDDAIWEKGMFANQNTVCRMSSKFTLERLIDRFGLSS